MDGARTRRLDDARPKDSRTRQARQTRRQITEHAGRRVRPRGNGSHPRRQARRTLDGAGDRDWPFESTARRCEAASAEEGHDIGEDAQGGQACVRSRPQQRGAEEASISEALARGHESVASRRPQCGVEERALEARTLGGAQTQRDEQIRLGAQGRAYERAEHALGRSAQGRTYASAPATLKAFDRFSEASIRCLSRDEPFGTRLKTQ